jgi:thioesterase domain-containing protein
LLQKHVQLGLGPRDVVAQTAPATFDFSVRQFLSALLCGAAVEIVPDEVVRDPAALWGLVAERGVTVLEAVPSLMQAMLAEPVARELPLRWLLPTGEALPPALANQWLAAYPQVPLLNVYGPAECADDVSLHAITRPLPAGCAHAPIGRPVANLRLHVLSDDGQALPVGVAGELCIAGIGVGRGYLGDPMRTAGAFVPDPLATEPGARMYLSGDIARWRPDGTLEYLGRRDHQVKLRGHRIELGEVEAAFARQPRVERAVCLLRDNDALVVYVTGAELSAESAEALRAAVADALPPYMLPQAVVVLPELPLNANGKVDRKALPDIDLWSAGSTYVAPASAMEALLANVWSEVLGLSRVGVHDHFFALGGHSLLAVRAMQKTRQLVQRELPLTLIFRAPTIAAMAAELSAEATQRSPLIALRGGDAAKRPLFCVHPAGGHVASYLPLVQSLAPDQPVYGLQSRSLHDPQWHNVSIEAMARDYAAEIREQQPQGPYQLLGWSMGGTLAMAIAAELESRGHAVAWVGLIDTVHLRDDEAAVRADHAAECVNYLEGLLRDNTERDALRALRSDLVDMSADEQLAHAVAWARDRGLLPSQTDVADVRLRLESRHESFRLMRGHRPRPVQAPVHLWQAEQTVRESTEAELSWAPYAQRLAVHAAEPGDHLDIVRSPALAAGVATLLHTTNAARAAMEN